MSRKRASAGATSGEIKVSPAHLRRVADGLDAAATQYDIATKEIAAEYKAACNRGVSPRKAKGHAIEAVAKRMRIGARQLRNILRGSNLAKKVQQYVKLKPFLQGYDAVTSFGDGAKKAREIVSSDQRYSDLQRHPAREYYRPVTAEWMTMALAFLRAHDALTAAEARIAQLQMQLKKFEQQNVADAAIPAYRSRK